MPKLLNIKHVFFDLDHTLWDFEENSKNAYKTIFKQNKIGLHINDFIEIYTPINHAYWKLYRDEKINKKDLKYARLKDTFIKLKFLINDDLILKLADDYLDELAKQDILFDGTIDLLEYLQQKYNLHIITNGFNEIQLSKLKKSKINHFFKHVFTSESVQVKKPNPKIFFHALEITNAKTYESIMIGDNIEADIYGAKNIGLKTIYCNFDNNKSIKNTITVSNLNEIKNYL